MDALSGPIFDEITEITIVELREVCSIQTKLVDEMIDEGILEPISGLGEERRFPYSSVRRTRTVPNDYPGRHLEGLRHDYGIVRVHSPTTTDI